MNFTAVYQQFAKTGKLLIPNSNTAYTLFLKNPNILSKSLISFSNGVNKSSKSES